LLNYSGAALSRATSLVGKYLTVIHAETVSSELQLTHHSPHLILYRYSMEPSPSPSPSPSILPSTQPSIDQEAISATIEFYIYNLSHEINQKDIETFEALSFAYLLSKVIGESPKLTSFTVKSQTMVQQERRLRGLEGKVRVLKIVATVSALTSLINPMTSNDLLDSTLLAIGSEEYEQHLGSSELFALVTTSLELDSPIPEPENLYEPPAGPAETPEIDNKGSGTTALVSSVVVLSVLVMAIGLLYRKKYGLNCTTRSKERKEIGILSDPSNDPSSYGGSFDDGGGTVDHSFLSRVLSRNSSEDSPLDLHPMNYDDPLRDVHTNVRAEHGRQGGADGATRTSPSAWKKNLFASSPTSMPIHHIPPMIVIDNIDEEEMSPPKQHSDTNANQVSASRGNHEQYENQNENNGIVVRRMEATSDLVAAFSAKKVPNPMQAYNLLQ